MILESITIYPLKSAQGISLSSVALDAMGLVDDRRWLLVDASGQTLSQREWPILARFSVSLGPDWLEVTSPTGQTAHIPRGGGPPVAMRLWGEDLLGSGCGAAADAFFSEALGLPTRCVYVGELFDRPVDPRYAGPDDRVGGADGFPLLVATEASLADLNARLHRPVEMDRFRPNLVIKGAAAFAEEAWTHLHIGDIPIELVKRCTRCVMVTVDPARGVFDGSEPLRTLAAYRKIGGKVGFGMNGIARRLGRLSVGDTLQIGLPE